MAEIILPAKFVFFKTNIFLLSGLFNMIIGSVGRWVGESVVVGRWSVDFDKTLGHHDYTADF